MEKLFIKLAIILCFLSILLGAFASHLLKEFLTESDLSSFLTGTRYQMFHGISILVLSLNQKKFKEGLSNVLIIMITGTILFSFSIYLLSTQSISNISISYLALLTPIGGLLMICSWAMLLFQIKNNT